MHGSQRVSLMGRTPLALIVLENQGNYTNPIHQRERPGGASNSWACFTFKCLTQRLKRWLVILFRRLLDYHAFSTSWQSGWFEWFIDILILATACRVGWCVDHEMTIYLMKWNLVFFYSRIVTYPFKAVALFSIMTCFCMFWDDRRCLFPAKEMKSLKRSEGVLWV